MSTNHSFPGTHSSARRAQAKPTAQFVLPPRLVSLLWAAAGLFVLLALVSFDPADLSLFTSHPNHPVHNLTGVAGAWVASVGRSGFGLASLILPALCWAVALQLWRSSLGPSRWPTRLLAGAFLLGSLGTLAALIIPDDPTSRTWRGGAVGYLLVHTGGYYLGTAGTAILASCLAALSWFLITDQPILHDGFVALVQRLASFRFRRAEDTLASHALRRPSTVVEPRESQSASRPVPAQAQPRQDKFETATEAEPPRIRSTVTPKAKVLNGTMAHGRQTPGDFQLPPLDLLKTPPPVSERQLGEDLQVNARVLEETLREFGIEARCVNIDRGPTVTRYELAPAPGVKLTKIVSLADDLALVLKAVSCHIVAPIPGKGLVGVEVPNSSATIVYLKEVLTSPAFQRLASPLALAIGKDVSGAPVVSDLRECPHLLIAGATGSGKTVCLNSLLTGMFYHAGPDEMKFLMIDPKMVELVLFNDIPHLVTPVVTDAKRAAAALQWAVGEMERRYQMLAKAGARNIEAYNQKITTFTNQETGNSRLPYLVIVVDELADLMMLSSKDVEEAITRLAQLSRAVGLHIILATQRPSVDVITGVIKANFPTRIAFQVASKVDSRTILDGNGADKLVGRGDLLFLKPGSAKPIRAQASFLTDEEIERVVAHLKAQRQPIYSEELIARQDRPAEAMASGEKDELYEMAKKLVIETRQASTSLLQRRLRLGYGRAARILDLMEQEGIVGPPQGSRPREVLVEPQAMETQS
ncbi:MAG: DNA translocase FtsK [Candidatus Omnitrophica bacterium]|nr:DNA translocase FtsK [Candidatus Omnitrophota bacterium]